MKSSIVPAALAALAGTVAGLGINCRGSSQCPESNGDMQNLHDDMSRIQGDYLYQNGQRIACHLDDGTNTGGTCVFVQGTKGGLLGSVVQPLMQALLDHGCSSCGSVPIGFLEGDNNPDDFGILTVNYVADIGSCVDQLCST